jgi:prepilin-type N-terminal cleavage/methylation domain-containing protein
MTAIRRVRRTDDAGYTLTELLVSMGIFAVLLALVAASTTTMFGSLRKQTGQTDNLDNSRKVIQLLDKQVRYASAVNTPGTGTDGSLYVEWQSGNTGQLQTCYQWRWVPSTKLLQYRTYSFLSATPDTITTQQTWVTEGNGISQSGSTPVFSITYAVVSPPPSPSPVVASHELLTVTFVSTHGNPAKSTTSNVSLTAANSATSSAPTTAVCGQHGRPSP